GAFQPEQFNQPGERWTLYHQCVALGTYRGLGQLRLYVSVAPGDRCQQPDQPSTGGRRRHLSRWPCGFRRLPLCGGRDPANPLHQLSPLVRGITLQSATIAQMAPKRQQLRAGVYRSFVANALANCERNAAGAEWLLYLEHARD